MSGQTTYTINFKAQFNDLSKIKQELQSITENQEIQLKLGGQKNLMLLQSSLKSLEDKLASSMDERGEISLDSFKQVSILMQNVLKMLQKFKLDLASATIPKNFVEQLEKVEDKITNLKNINKELGSLKSSLSRKWNIEDGEASPSKSQKNRTVIEAAGPDALEPGTNKMITSYEQLERIVQSLLQSNKQLTESEQQVINIWNQVQDTLKNGAKQAVEDWQDLNQQIEANRAEIANLNNESKKLQTEGLNTSDTSNSIRDLVNSFTEITDTLSVDYTRAVDTAEQAEKNRNKTGQTTSQILNSTNNQIKLNTNAINTNTKATNRNQSVLSKAVTNVISYGTVLKLVRTVYTKLISTITEMDKALTDMTVVTSLTREQAWGLTNQLADLAKTTGMTTTAVAEMTTKYLQQGKSLADSIKLTEAAAKAARIAGISGSDSINLLTNAMNGFQMSANQAMEVSDKFAALAASAATDYEELATALSKVAAQANLAGMSMDFTLGMLTKGIEVTREAPETIGTALKTVIARMRELTDYGATLEDGIDVNRVAKALDNIGVELLDENRQFRNLEDVLTEVGEKWDKLNTNQQANVAVALAGTRQQSRLIAMMQDFDRTQELVNISMKSAGATAAQHSNYMQGLEAAVTNLTTSYQNLITNFTNSDIAIAVVNALGDALSYLANNMHIVWTVLGAIGIAFAPYLAQQIKLHTATLLSSIAIKANTTAIEEQRLAEAKANVEKLEAANRIEEQRLALQEETLAVYEKVAADKQAQAASAMSAASTAQENVVLLQNTRAKLENTKAILNSGKAKALEAGNSALAMRYDKQISRIEGQLADNKTKLTEAEQERNEAAQRSNQLQLESIQAEQAAFDQKLKCEQTLETIKANNAALDVARTLVSQAGKVKTFKLTMQQILAEKLQAAGIKETTAAEMAKNIIDNASIALTALKNILRGKEVKQNWELLKQKLGLIKATTTETVVDGGATVAKLGLATATKILKSAIESVPIIGWILAIIGLVIALAKAISQTEAFGGVLSSFKNIGQAVFDIIGSIIKVIMTIINLIVDLLQPAIEATMGLLNVIVGIIEIVVEVINGLVSVITSVVEAIRRFIKMISNAIESIPIIGDVVKGVKSLVNGVSNFFKNAGNAIKNFFGGITGWIDRLFETSEDKSKRYAKEIAENQTKIYKNSQLKSNLEPLIKEYEQLSNKAVKSAEDLERLQAIEDEVAQYNEGYVVNGSVDWDKVKGDVDSATAQNDALYAQNKAKALKGIKTGYIQDEFKTALSDYYTSEMLKDDSLSIVQQQAIQKNLETAFNNIDYNAINQKAIKGKSVWELLTTGPAANHENIFDNLGESIIQFNKVLYDEEADLGSQLTIYANHFETLDETVQGTFASTFVYFEQMRAMAKNTGVALEEFANKLNVLGLNANTYGELENAVKSSLTQGKDESNEDFAKRQEDTWNRVFGTAIQQGGSKMDMVGLMLQNAVDEDGKVDQAIVNAISSTLIKSNQAAIEDYMKKSSSLDNIVEMSLKAQQGTLTNDEIRTLFEENPDLFSSVENVQKFLQGDTSFVADERVKNHNELKTALEEQKTFAEQQLALNEQNNFLTEEQVKNLQMQINLANTQLDNLKYQDLYSSEIWKNYANQTKEMQSQIRLTKKLNDLEKEYKKLTTTEDKLDNIKQRSAIYAAEKAQADKLLNSDEYTQLQNIGLEFVDGEIILDSSKLKSQFGEDYTSNQQYLDLLKWAEENQDNIKDAQEVVNEYDDIMDDVLGDYKAIIEEEYQKNIDALEQEKDLLEKRQEQYEEYFDKMDALQEEQERAESRESVVAQLAALQGGSDAASNNLRKDLLQQLSDITKEEEDARKQAARDALTESIENHVKHIDESIDQWQDKIDNLDSADINQVFSILQGLGYDTAGYTVEYNPNDTSHGVIKDVNGKEIFRFAQGGLVDFTGPAWVDGTKSRPEAFLNPHQTEIIQQLVKGLEYNLSLIDKEVDGANNITVENINITTQQLNNDQDFKTAGQIFAEEFGKAIKQRGLNVNVRK